MHVEFYPATAAARLGLEARKKATRRLVEVQGTRLDEIWMETEDGSGERCDR
jgi:hypothetical protein